VLRPSLILRPAVRQHALQAIAALHLPPHGLVDAPFPLSTSKITRMIASEKDCSVLAVLLRLLRTSLEVGEYRGTQLTT
jgi:hypothetical protein